MFEDHVVKELSSRETTRTVCKEHEKELEALKYFCQSCGVSKNQYIRVEILVFRLILIRLLLTPEDQNVPLQ